MWIIHRDSCAYSNYSLIYRLKSLSQIFGCRPKFVGVILSSMKLKKLQVMFCDALSRLATISNVKSSSMCLCNVSVKFSNEFGYILCCTTFSVFKRDMES